MTDNIIVLTPDMALKELERQNNLDHTIGKLVTVLKLIPALSSYGYIFQNIDTVLNDATEREFTKALKAIATCKVEVKIKE